MIRWRWIPVLLALLLGVASAEEKPTVQAAPGVPVGPVDEGLFGTTERLLMCDCLPPCGKSLANCACGHSTDLRERIRYELSTGKDPEEIVALFISESHMGNRLRTMPSAGAFGQFTNALPFLLLALGALAVLFLGLGWLRKSGADRPAPGSETTTIDPEILARVEEELDRYEEERGS